MHVGRGLVSAGAFVALALAAGCGGDGMADVAGTVTVDGQPAAAGSVGFTPVDGRGATSGGEIKDGRYAFRAPVGKVKVEVRVSRSTGQKKKLYNTPDSPTRDVMAEVLPAKYNERTELTFEVQPGKNEKNWDLSSK